MTHIIDIASQILRTSAAAPGSWVFWAVRAEAAPAEPPPSEAETTAFELVKVRTSGPGGYEPTGLLFWDENDDMAENLACCINEDCGIGPDRVLEIVRANMARDALGRTIH